MRDEERKLLSVDTVRQVCADAYIRPNEGARKVYGFEDSGQLDGRCQDILLKTVEEGPATRPFCSCRKTRRPFCPRSVPAAWS